MKTFFRIVLLNIMVVTIISSCSKEAEKKTPLTSHDSVSGPEVRSVIDSVIEVKRNELILKANDEAEKAGKKIMDLAIKQKTAENKMKISIGKEIEILKLRKNRLGEILLELKIATKESLAAYEKQLIEIIKDQSPSENK